MRFTLPDAFRKARRLASVSVRLPAIWTFPPAGPNVTTVPPSVSVALLKGFEENMMLPVANDARSSTSIVRYLFTFTARRAAAFRPPQLSKRLLVNGRLAMLGRL